MRFIELKEYYKIELNGISASKFIYAILFASLSGYIIYLRFYEYLLSKKLLIIKPLRLFVHWRLSRISLKTGISIPAGVCGKGLTLRHYGSIVVNSAARIGCNCCIHNNVNIGANKGGKIAPKIGDNVYINSTIGSTEDLLHEYIHIIMGYLKVNNPEVYSNLL